MTVTEKISSTEKLALLIEKEFKKDSISNLRSNALKSFIKQGLPGRKNEEYKYSPTEKLFSSDLEILSATKNKIDIISFLVPELNANVVVIVNGIFSESLSAITDLPNGVLLKSLRVAFNEHSELVKKYFAKTADISTDAIIAANTALVNDGVFLYVPQSVAMAKPLHILNIISSDKEGLANTRHLFIAENNASVNIVERFETVNLPVKTINNTLSEVIVNDEANVKYYKLQNDCENGNQINTTVATVGNLAHFDTNTITLNGGWIRNNLTIKINGEHSEAHLNGLFITTDNLHVDNHTAVDHNVPNCQSNQLYKGVLNDKSTGVFNGKIYVKKDAQKTNAYQSSKNILLSDNATINTKPQLEIYADDVRCSHGSSTGRIDADALFYLRARGLSDASARKLLMLAFANDVLNTIQIEPLKNYLITLVEQKMQSLK
jgi:Fe-S cluster assembly protein SufD